MTHTFEVGTLEGARAYRYLNDAKIGLDLIAVKMIFTLIRSHPGRGWLRPPMARHQRPATTSDHRLDNIDLNAVKIIFTALG
jgi:hypothetical protein